MAGSGRGPGSNRAKDGATAFSLLNSAGTLGRCGSASGSRRTDGSSNVLARVSRATWRLDQAERERRWALASAHAEGIWIRTLATAAGLSASRVHQLVAAADCDALDAALGELPAAG
jgi:hypothetical protein